MDKKEIKQKYKKLLNEVEHDNFYKMDLSNRINCYICKCGQITKTKDIDPGVTPFMISCIKCGAILKTYQRLNDKWKFLKAEKEDVYTCPSCGEMMLYKKNKIRQSHENIRK